MGKTVYTMLLLCLLFQYASSQEARLNSSIERSALLDLRSSLGLRSSDWPLKVDPCSLWKGIQCKNGHVTGINISGFKRTRAGRLNTSFSVDSLVNFTFLESFNASRFPLPGPIPVWFGYQLGSLQVLDLRFCSMIGPIPDSIGNLTVLRGLYLSNNRLAGRIPSAMGQLENLRVLDLSRNTLAGLIPSNFGLLKSMYVLDLSSNYLSGPIPPGLGGISTLQSLKLSDNSLVGSIPVELGNLSQLVELNFTYNFFSGLLPVEFVGLRSLKRLEIGDNGLEGSLPDGLFSGLDRLEIVDLSGNKLDGAIPGALLSLPNLLILDLSDNNFTGILSNFSLKNDAGSGSMFNLSNNLLYGNLSFSVRNISMFDLSGNYIQGKIPDDGQKNISLGRNCLQAEFNQRSLGDCKLFYEERGLSFDNFGALEPMQPPVPEPAPKKKKQWIYILAGLLVGVAFIVIVVLVLLVILRKCDKRSKNQRGRSANVGPVPEGDSPSVPKDPNVLSSLRDSFTYEQLLSSTGAFNEANLIRHGHSGHLYRGFLDGGCPIVVKKVDFRYSKKESYLMELEFFSKYSHTRLVPMLGHCSANENEKFFVYKYMPNGDLASSLYRVTDLEDDSIQSLDWITRLKIAIGAAEGLSYLHHECNPPVIHRDIQASSILLDDKFEVRIGSLSDIRVQEGDSHKVLTRFLRRQQSSEAGSSGSSSTTCAYDVYCFGKVLLELITGKLGISKSDDLSTKEWLEYTLGYISLYDKELVTKIVDPSLIIDEDLLEEVWAMAIVARSCLNPKPSKRPPMKYVLKALENPLKVVREDSYSSGRLRTTSSRRSWSTMFFGSWRQSSSDNPTVISHTNREGVNGLKQPGRVGSYGSGGVEHFSSNKRLSNEIFPEPLEILEQQ